MAFCMRCGAKLTEQGVFCSSCGAKVEGKSSSPSAGMATFDKRDDSASPEQEGSALDSQRTSMYSKQGKAAYTDAPATLAAEMEEAVCPRCQEAIQEILTYCPSCGHELKLPYNPQEEWNDPSLKEDGTWERSGVGENKKSEEPEGSAGKRLERQRVFDDRDSDMKKIYSDEKSSFARESDEDCGRKDGTGRELYRRKNVAHVQGLFPTNGSITVLERQIRFEPVVTFTGNGFIIPMNRITQVCSGELLGMDILLLIETRDGQLYKFTFGVGNQGERNRAMEIIKKNVERAIP